MTRYKSQLTDYQEERGPDVIFEDDNVGKTKAYGILSNGKVIFKIMAYVESLKHSLLSISQLCDSRTKCYLIRF